MNKPLYNFEKQNQKSKEGIEIIRKHLLELGCYREIINVEDDPKYRKKDIDLIAITHQGQRIKIEVKYDTYPERNLFYETISNSNYNTPGCLEYSEADVLVYIYKRSNAFYAFDLKMLRTWVRENKEKFQESGAENDKDKSGKPYSSKGYKVPLSLFSSSVDRKYWKRVELRSAA